MIGAEVEEAEEVGEVEEEEEEEVMLDEKAPMGVTVKPGVEKVGGMTVVDATTEEIDDDEEAEAEEEMDGNEEFTIVGAGGAMEATVGGICAKLTIGIWY